MMIQTDGKWSGNIRRGAVAEMGERVLAALVHVATERDWIINPTMLPHSHPHRAGSL